MNLRMYWGRSDGANSYLRAFATQWKRIFKIMRRAVVLWEALLDERRQKTDVLSRLVTTRRCWIKESWYVAEKGVLTLVSKPELWCPTYFSSLCATACENSRVCANNLQRLSLLYSIAVALRIILTFPSFTVTTRAELRKISWYIQKLASRYGCATR